MDLFVVPTIGFDLLYAFQRPSLWALVDEPIVNKHFASIEDLENKIANQCVALAGQPEKLKTRTGFHWWPKPFSPK